MKRWWILILVISPVVIYWIWVLTWIIAQATYPLLSDTTQCTPQQDHQVIMGQLSDLREEIYISNHSK